MPTHFLLLLSVFLFACTPKKEVCSIPSNLRWESEISDFKGSIVVGTSEVPFLYRVKEDRMVFPLTYLGFISYRNKVLRAGKEKIVFPLPLWRILKHRLVGKDCQVQTFGGSHLIRTSPAEGVGITLKTDKRWNPKEAQICTLSGCYLISYRGREIEVEYNLREVLFKVNPSRPRTSGYRPRSNP